jgi:signal transduction histidine kinase
VGQRDASRNVLGESIQRRSKTLGGMAHWQSAPGRGRVFTVTLPLRR